MNRPSYYLRIVEAIDTQSIPKLKDTLTELRSLRLAFLVLEGDLDFNSAKRESVSAMSTFDLINVRGEGDITPIATLCHRYAMKLSKGDDASCQRLDAMAAWMLDQGAVPMMECGRSLIRTHNAQAPTYTRGRGRTILEVFGLAQLPPTIAEAILSHDDRTFEGARMARYEMQHMALA